MKELGIVRGIDLNPEDWLWATWRDRDFWQILEVKPFDKEEALGELQQIFIDKHGSRLKERWWRSQIPLPTQRVSVTVEYGSCYFSAGRKRLELGAVDPLVMSEVLRDLAAVRN